MSRPFLDTNILIYSVLTGDARKRDIAVTLAGEPSALSIQVLQEFYFQTTRISRRERLAHDEARQLVDAWLLRHEVQPMTVDVLTHALALRTRTNYSYWDCAIVAAAAALGCRELLTEDLDAGRTIDGVRIVNPFAA